MVSTLGTFALLVRLAFRNLFASRLKTVIVGGIVFFGALLVTVGNSFLDSIVTSMSHSIIGSAAGHIQVYSSKSKDDLELFGGFQESDLAQVDDFAKVKTTIEAVPNVKSVVPMGVAGALVTSGNTVDVVLEKLRGAVRKKLHGDTSPEVLALIESEKGHVRQIVSVLERDLANMRAVAEARAISPEEVAAVTTAASEAFWAGFDKDPLSGLEMLENKIAPLATDADLLYLRYIGTDTASFAQSFDRLKIVDGGPIPSGKRGFMFAKYFYEEYLKLKTARRLDKIKEGIEVKRLTIAADADLGRMNKENATQTREILLQLDAARSKQAVESIRKELGVSDGELPALLSKVLDANDTNFAQRYRFFYDRLAPMLDLYRIRVGDALTIKAFTRTGYMQSVNLRVYGTFDFQGLEKSALAGSLNIMDLVSFRDLYGFLTADKIAEIKKLKEKSGMKDVARENAEAELFGDGKTVVAEATPGVQVEIPEVGGGTGEKFRREEAVDRVYPTEELQRGVVLNAAVILKDPSRLEDSIRDVEAAAKNAGLELKVVSWQKAAGLIGQLVYLFRVILIIAVLVIFLVALVIINNALVMATLERIREIGTLRAVGAQRTFILGMLIVEALTIGGIFGTLGAAVGAGVVKVIGKVGVPATTDVMFFFFSGPRLHPTLGTSSLIAALLIVLVVSAFSSFYPAWLAMKVTPVQAMSTAEE